ncbi:MAG: hypothetical protein IKJ32_01525 [Clostridia bacterium]|nr:hypothetical protein [Clostridia bacterium]
MANFTQKIKSKYNVNTYEETKKAYEWIVYSIEKLKLSNKKTEVEFYFYTGDIGCECNSLEEFTKYAYGQDRYRLITLKVMQYQNDGKSIIYASCFGSEVYLSTEDKMILEKVVKSLEETNIDKDEKNTSNINIQQNLYNIGSINGNNNNIVQGNDNKVIIDKEQKKESKFKNWIEAILQNLLANWIWIVITVVGGAIIGIITTK